MQLSQLTTHLPRKAPPATATRRRAPRAPHAIPTREVAERRDARRGGGPQDTALYTCGCGYAFTAPVSTSVGVPALRHRAGLVAVARSAHAAAEAGEGNRTPISGLGSQRLNHWTTPAGVREDTAADGRASAMHADTLVGRCARASTGP